MKTFKIKFKNIGVKPEKTRGRVWVSSVHPTPTPEIRVFLGSDLCL